MRTGTLCLSLSVLLLTGCAARGTGAETPEGRAAVGHLEVETANGFMLQLQRPDSLDQLEIDTMGLDGEPGVGLARQHEGCDEDHPVEAYFFSVVPAVEGSCLPVAQRQRIALRELGEFGCESMEIGALICVGSSPDSVCEFEFSHDCLCSDGLPAVGRLATRMSDVPGQCLIAVGNWPRADDRAVSRVFERMFETAAVTRAE